MQADKIIGETTRVFPRLRCVAIKLAPNDTVLREGMTVSFHREASDMGALGFHDSTHKITSIEVNRTPVAEATHQDGICAVWIGGSVDDLPPRRCIVSVINDRAPDQPTT
ncbi:MAG: hypothetical protein WCV71_00380 [Patescibacteria group bacterium]